MKKTGFLSIIVLWTLFTIPSFSQMTKIDSLLQAIELSSGEEKLESLYELAVLERDTEDLLTAANELEQEAKKQNNKNFLSHSYEFKARYFLYQNNSDSILYYSDLINELFDEDNTENFLIHIYLAQMYINKGYHDLAIYNLEHLLQKIPTENKDAAYHLLGTAYSASGRYKSAKECHLKALELNEEMGLDPIKKAPLYEGLLVALTLLGEYDIALKYCSEFNDYIEQYKGVYSQTTINNYLFILYNVYTNIYINLNDTEKVNFYFNKFRNISIDGLHDTFKQMRSSTFSEYYLFNGNLDRALTYIEDPLAYYKKENTSKSIVDGLRKTKIEILEKQGNYKEALYIQKELTTELDSIYQENVPLQINEISKKAELDKAKIEQQKAEIQLEKSRIIIIGFAIVILLLCFIIFLFRRNTKKMKEKNKILFKKYEETDRYTDSPKGIDNSKEAKEAISLFNKIDSYMKGEEAYKNPNLTREDVAAALNTNRQYLTDAIKSETGKTFLEYVNHYRLSYARRQLMNHESLPVNNIIFESGFPSIPTFYRLFKEEFGMSPNELRQVKAELMLEIEK